MPSATGPRTSSNPMFDKRMQSYPPFAFGAGLVRGFMVTDEPVNDVYYRVNFLRNPSVVSMQHSLDSEVNLDPNERDPNDQTFPLVPLKSGVSFNLLFDRTYETWANNTALGTKLGVWADILALYNLCGMTLGISSTDDSGKIETKAQNLNSWVTSPMTYRPTWVYFGGPMKYYGSIVNLDIQITHWTVKMVPNRAQVSVAFQPFPASATKTRPWEWGSTSENATSSVNAAEYNNPRYAGGVLNGDIYKMNQRTTIGRGGR